MSLAGVTRLDAFLQSLSEFQDTFDGWLCQFLDAKAAAGAVLDADLSLLFDELRGFSTRAGKRLRPFLVYWGYRAAGGDDDEALIPITIAAEMLHVFALAHDDVMDQSDVRRGLPTVHRDAESRHLREGWRGSPGQFGLSIAILLGDLAFALSDALIDGSPLAANEKARLRVIWNSMREEVIHGQFLDVLTSNRRTPAPEAQIWSILSLKSGKYTLERPLHLGAAAAGGPDSLLDLFTRFGVPLGRAFQITDDILGLFGTPDRLGKPVDSDIKEGKSTLLFSRAFHSADSADRETLLRVWGCNEASDADISVARDIIRKTGALGYASQCAQDLAEQARQALTGADLQSGARDVLLGLADFMVNREA